MTELLNEKPTLLKYLGLIEEVNVDLGATDKRSPSGELMILSVKGSENSGTLTYGNITDGNQTHAFHVEMLINWNDHWGILLTIWDI